MQGMVSLSDLRQGLRMSSGQIDRLIDDGFFAATISMEPQKDPIRGFHDALRLVALRAFPGYPDELAGVVAGTDKAASDRWLVVSRRPESNGGVIELSEVRYGRSAYRQFSVDIVDDAELVDVLSVCKARGEWDIRVEEFDRLYREAENAFRQALNMRGQTNYEVAL